MTVSDLSVQNKAKTEADGVNNLKFFPFYERIAVRFPVHFIGKLLVSVLLGLIFLVVHYMSIKEKVFEDWSWLLAILVSTAMIFLYYATHTLRTMFPEMDRRLGLGKDTIYLTPLKRILSDRNFIIAGLLFGVVNCGFGYSFGSPYLRGFAVFTIFYGYFLAGFVCGMAAYGIYGVLITINTFSREIKPSLDFTTPDHCGGTLFIGNALVVFSLVTLIVGVMISVYILNAEWTRKHTWWIGILKWFWVAFPYIMSLVALFGPAIEVNKALLAYKVEKEKDLQSRMIGLRNRIENEQLDVDQSKALQEHYEYLTRLRNQLYKMRTWPYGLSANLKYLTVFVANLYVSVNSVLKWLEKLSILKTTKGS